MKKLPIGDTRGFLRAYYRCTVALNHPLVTAKCKPRPKFPTRQSIWFNKSDSSRATTKFPVMNAATDRICTIAECMYLRLPIIGALVPLGCLGSHILLWR
ncbi:uncharacterized protein BO72DRAFT_451622 [Aspergillus fijiensis CBS 313.89]|uniref:Uncharacterized protein n=1 Tax=Aspergillus fijiensis CBS 313.89 TaxID=1448319 RepID=A0A8G1RK39_9EURO|nr:uncharacterized protein BO72DRAFT_451622 [Aspergillus fijiensis CBS 313.89]RAK73613.1 hypothetical protein BO72DRAFT_451622 [Aspergillus fijiensis CBS 313.89]